MKAILCNLKTTVPASIERYKGTKYSHIYDGWLGHPVEPYGHVMPGYGQEYPYSVPHIAIRLGIDGVAAFSVAAIDEFVDSLPARLPSKPSYCGMSGGTYHAEYQSACGY